MASPLFCVATISFYLRASCLDLVPFSCFLVFVVFAGAWLDTYWLLAVSVAGLIILA